MWISSKGPGRQSQAAGQRRSSFQRPSWVYLERGKSEREPARYGVCRGARPECPHSCRGKDGSQRSRPGAARGAADPRRTNISPRSFLSRCLPRSPLLFLSFFLFFFNCNRNKTSSGCHRDHGQVVFLESSEHLVGLGPGSPRGGGEGCAPSRSRGLAAGRPRAEYLCYILKNLNK